MFKASTETINLTIYNTSSTNSFKLRIPREKRHICEKYDSNNVIVNLDDEYSSITPTSGMFARLDLNNKRINEWIRNHGYTVHDTIPFILKEKSGKLIFTLNKQNQSE